MSARTEHPFPPVVDPDCTVLLLGSFPSVKSRAEGFYYGHPRNRFWQVIAAVYGETVPQTIPEKQALLLRHHIALWDVIASCAIQGSSDASVKDAVPVDITQVTGVCRIQRVLCGGALSGRLYERFLQEKMGVAAQVMPSTSPANAAWTLERLTQTWGKALLG